MQIMKSEEFISAFKKNQTAFCRKFVQHKVDAT